MSAVASSLVDLEESSNRACRNAFDIFFTYFLELNRVLLDGQQFLGHVRRIVFARGAAQCEVIGDQFHLRSPNFCAVGGIIVEGQNIVPSIR